MQPLPNAFSLLLVFKLYFCVIHQAISCTLLYFNMFLGCVCDQDFHKLSDRLQLKDVKNDEHFINLLRCRMEVLVEVIPSDILPYLLSKNVIRLANFITILMLIWLHCRLVNITVKDWYCQCPTVSTMVVLWRRSITCSITNKIVISYTLSKVTICTCTTSTYKFRD